MELTFVNVLLFVALAVVCFLFGYRTGNRRGYTEGHVAGIFAGERGIKQLLTETELRAVEEREKKLARELINKYIGQEVLDKYIKRR